MADDQRGTVWSCGTPATESHLCLWAESIVYKLHLARVHGLTSVTEVIRNTCLPFIDYWHWPLLSGCVPLWRLLCCGFGRCWFRQASRLHEWHSYVWQHGGDALNSTTQRLMGVMCKTECIPNRSEKRCVHLDLSQVGPACTLHTWHLTTQQHASTFCTHYRHSSSYLKVCCTFACAC